MVSTIGSAETHQDVLENPDHINLADARRGMVLAAILGPCGAARFDQDHRS
jgi:uncharacterized protein YqfA (UPF0365 family)